MVKPYFPDVIQGCVNRINASFSLRSVDPFEVFFDKGLLSQVRRNVNLNILNFPLVWLVFQWGEDFGKFSIASELDFNVMVVMPTENTYTQQEREDLIFKPRLIPIADQFIKELGRERQFLTNGERAIQHRKEILPYWGLGDVNGQNDVPNLFANMHLEAIKISVRQLKMKPTICSVTQYSILDVGSYPVGNTELVFFDDIELIVGGGEIYDPVHNSTSIIIPELKFTTFEVHQRLMGKLRTIRNVEMIPDNINGGFSLVGQHFSSGDTFIVKRRPRLLI